MARRCACGCGGDLPPRASKQMLYLPRHRQRRYQRNKDAAVRDLVSAVGGLGNVKTTARAERRRRSRRTVHRPLPRYALVEKGGATFTIHGFASASSKRAVEGLFGIRDRQDLFALAAAHLPVVT